MVTVASVVGFTQHVAARAAFPTVQIILALRANSLRSMQIDLTRSAKDPVVH